jgi:hypothetical protein
MELYFHSPVCLHGVYRDNVTFVFTGAVLFNSGIVILILKTVSLDKMDDVRTLTVVQAMNTKYSYMLSCIHSFIHSLMLFFSMNPLQGLRHLSDIEFVIMHCIIC